MIQSEVVTKDKFKEILDSAVDKVKFQKFIQLVTHAQTCIKCAPYYNKALSIAEHHMQESHR